MLDNSFEDDMQRTVAAGAAEDAGTAVAVEDEIDVDVEWLDDGPDGVWPVGPEGGAGVVPENGADGDPEDFGDLDDEDEAEEIGYDDYMLGIIGVVKSALESDGIEPDVLAAKVKNLHEGPESPASAAAAGKTRIGEALGDLYMNEMLFNCGRLGLSVEECRQRATGFLYKAACDVGYPARGDCAFKLALLFYAPRYEAPDLKQAKDWFGWTAQELEKSAPHKAAEAWLYLGRIAEAEGDYAEAARCRKKHDGLSGDRRGEAEQARMQITAGLDEMAGICTLIALAEDRDALLAGLLHAGCLEVREPTDALSDPEMAALLRRDTSGAADARVRLNLLKQAVETLDRYAPQKGGGLFAPRAPMAEKVLLDPKALEDAVDLDALGQLLQALGGEVLPGLVRIGLQGVGRQPQHPAGREEPLPPVKEGHGLHLLYINHILP